MSAAIAGQANLWLCAAALGAALLFFYDLLRIFRRVVPHGARAVGAEDFFYWLLVGGLVFALLYHFNNGIIRWFVVFGMLVGMLLYHLTLSAVLVDWASRVLQRMFRALRRILRRLLSPLRAAFAAFVTALGKSHKKVTKFLKKKLKRREKEGKMNKEKKAGVTGVEKRQEQKPQQTE